MNTKNIYVVVSPPRCGSSCLTRGLMALGVEVGTDLMAPAAHNPKGFFEDNALNDINAQLVEGMQKTQKGELVPNPLESHIFESACEILGSRVKNTEHYVFKDPRTSKFIPFWEKVFNTLNLNVYFLFALRNPLSFSKSVMNSSPENASMIWLGQAAHVGEYIKDKKHIVVDYDNMMTDPRTQLQRIANKFNMPYEQHEKSIEEFCDEFLEWDLRHHHYTMEQLQADRLIFPICKTIYTLYLKVANDECDLNNEEFQTEWKKVLEHTETNGILYRYIEALRFHAETMETQLKNSEARYQEYVKKHEEKLSWRMTKPLRNIQKLFTASAKAATTTTHA